MYKQVCRYFRPLGFTPQNGASFMESGHLFDQLLMDKKKKSDKFPF